MKFVWSIKDVNPTECSPVRRYTATALGVITLLCAASIVFMVVADLCLGAIGSKDAGYGVIGGFMLALITSPIASLCTLFAFLLVGPRRSRLAWISFCVAYIPFIAWMLAVIIYRTFIHSR
jgi:hypothetical protein